MPDKIKFIMILHNHQPKGNFDWVFRNVAEDAHILLRICWKSSSGHQIRSPHHRAALNVWREPSDHSDSKRCVRWLMWPSERQGVLTSDD